MKIWHISDTHRDNNLLKIPECDMVIHSGDATNPKDGVKSLIEMREFIEWFSSLDIKYKIFVAGNHDICVERRLILPSEMDFIYLENTTIEIEGIRIFGSPYTPSFGNGWAFNKSRSSLSSFWSSIIPDDTDILVTHGPPKGILDLAYKDINNIENCGDKALLNRIKEIDPILSLFGHIHNNGENINQGVRTIAGLNTVFSNGSVVEDGRFGRLSSNGNILEI